MATAIWQPWICSLPAGPVRKERRAGQYRRAQGQVGMGGRGLHVTYGTAESSVYSWKEGTLV
jgi:hypothetical protein